MKNLFNRRTVIVLLVAGALAAVLFAIYKLPQEELLQEAQPHPAGQPAVEDINNENAFGEPASPYASQGGPEVAAYSRFFDSHLKA